jgi:hypothetical protein
MILKKQFLKKNNNKVQKIKMKNRKEKINKKKKIKIHQNLEYLYHIFKLSLLLQLLFF